MTQRQPVVLPPGKMFALPLERAIRIRTREEGSEALLSGGEDETPHG